MQAEDPVRRAKEQCFGELTQEVQDAGVREVSGWAGPALKDVAEAFQSNMEGTIRTLSVPFELAFAGAADLAVKEEDRPDDLGRLVTDAYASLGMNLSQREEVRTAAAELLRQGAVLTWGGLEVFVSDFFVTLLNARPDFSTSLLNDPSTRKHFGVKETIWSIVEEYGFDLRNCIGRILGSQCNLGSVPMMKAVFKVLFPGNAPLQESLDKRPLRILAARRHAIVHRRGRVDSKYREESGESLPVGSELVVSPDDVREYMRCCCEVVRHLLLAGESALSGSQGTSSTT